MNSPQAASQTAKGGRAILRLRAEAPPISTALEGSQQLPPTLPLLGGWGEAGQISDAAPASLPTLSFPHALYPATLAALLNLLLASDHDEPHLAAELSREFPEARVQSMAQDLLALDPDFLSRDRPLHLVFARQFLPGAQPLRAASIRGWTDLLAEAILARLPDSQPWQLHVIPHFGAPTAGHHRCQLIRKGLIEDLRRRRRNLLRRLVAEPRPFSSEDSFIQLLLTSPETGWLSVAPAPLPFNLRHLLSPFPKGEVPIAVDKTAPSRAFAKLVEAELRLGRRIAPGETCVDLGASPGSWTHVALHRGARVIAVDRAPLRADLMRHPQLTFLKGDAFRFRPEIMVDWLLCDVIAAPDRSIDLLIDWARARRARRFVVTIKFKGASDYPKLDRLKQELPAWTSEFHLIRLTANKNEACAFGTVAAPGTLM